MNSRAAEMRARLCGFGGAPPEIAIESRRSPRVPENSQRSPQRGAREAQRAPEAAQRIPDRPQRGTESPREPYYYYYYYTTNTPKTYRPSII